MKLTLHHGAIAPERAQALSQRFLGGALTLFQYAPHRCGLDGLLAAAQLFSPEFTEIGGCVFVTGFLHPDFDETDFRALEAQHRGDRTAMERWFNAWSIGALFLNAPQDYLEDEALLAQFAECLADFWRARLRTVFPDREMTVELGEELEGEAGLCITVYTNRERSS